MSVEIKTYPADQYISLFIDPAARADVDAWFTVAYGDCRRPGTVLSAPCTPGGDLNYLRYDNPAVTDLLDQARATADDAERAQLIVEAQAIIAERAAADPGGVAQQHAGHLVRAHRRRGIVLDDVRTLGEPARRRLSDGPAMAWAGSAGAPPVPRASSRRC